MPDPPEWPTAWDGGPFQPRTPTWKRRAFPALRYGLPAAAAVVLVAGLVARVGAAQRVVHQAAAPPGHLSAGPGGPVRAWVGAVGRGFFLKTRARPGAPQA